MGRAFESRRDHTKRPVFQDRALFLFDFFAKGENAANGHLEVLDAERYADDGKEEDKTEAKVQNGNLPPAAKDPDEVHEDRYTSGLARAVHQLPAEGPERVGPQLEKLNPEGNANDRKAHQETYDVVDQGYDDASQQ